MGGTSMNVRIPAFAVSLALLAFAPVAGAQRASLAERVAALEQRAATDQGNVDLLNQVNALKSDVQALRAQIEELQHKQQQMEEAGRNQYLDLDGRIDRLEGGSTVAPSVGAVGGAVVAPPAPAPARAAASTGAAATAASSAVSPPRGAAPIASRSRRPIRSTCSTPPVRPAGPRAWCATMAGTWSTCSGPWRICTGSSRAR